MGQKKKYKFESVIKKFDGKDATYVEFPYDVEKEFGVKGQVKVKANFDGIDYFGSLTKMGLNCHWIIIIKDIREKIHKNAGDKVLVTIQKDLDVKSVKIPLDLACIFKDNTNLKQKFEALSYTKQLESIKSLENCVKIETRQKCMKKLISDLK